MERDRVFIKYFLYTHYNITLFKKAYFYIENLDFILPFLAMA